MQPLHEPFNDATRPQLEIVEPREKSRIGDLARVKHQSHWAMFEVYGFGEAGISSARQRR